MPALVSIVVPVYNNVHTIDEAIQSAIHLEYRPIEIVIIDDGSKDGSYERVLSWKNRYPEMIKVLKHEGRKNRGPGASRNLGIRRATGEYISFLDADDVLFPDRLSWAVEILTRNEKVDCVFDSASIELHTPKGAFAWRNRANLWSVPVEEGVDPSMVVLRKQSFWSMDSFLCRRELFDKVGLFNERLRVGEDRNMWLRVALLARLEPGRLDKPVCVVRRGDKHTWNPSRIHDTFRDIWSTSVVFLWATMKRGEPNNQRLAAFREGFREQIKGSIKTMREEKCCWRAWVIATSALLIPSLLFERTFWGNLFYCITDKFSHLRDTTTR